jgi:uncharacterized membrane protein YhhN
MVGDTALMLPGKPLAPALGGFFIAHVFTVCGFLMAAPLDPSQIPVAFWALLALWNIILVALLFKHLGNFLLTGLASFAVLNAMAIAAFNFDTSHQLGSFVALGVAALGGLLFLLSDSILAFGRFRFVFTGYHALVLITYYAAQACIVIGYSLAH